MSRDARRVDHGDPGARTLPARQKPLGGQLAVCIDDEPARDAEVGCEHPRRVLTREVVPEIAMQVVPIVSPMTI